MLTSWLAPTLGANCDDFILDATCAGLHVVEPIEKRLYVCAAEFGRHLVLLTEKTRKLRVLLAYFHDTHLYLHRGAILLDHRVGTFIGRTLIFLQIQVMHT